MTTAATSLLGLALPVTGELQGTWGTTVNDSITSLLDTAVAGTTTLSTDADVTLTTTTLASNQARQAILLCSGARTALRTITAPAQSKIYTIINATTGGFSVKLVGVGPTTGLTIPNGASAVVAWNGSDFIEIGSSTIGNLTVNGNLTVTGTTTLTGAATLTANPTLSAGTANGVAYLNGSKVLTTGSALTYDGTSFATTGQIISGGSYNFNTTAGRDILWGTGSYTYITGNPGTGVMAFGIANTEQMRLTSTGLGIGTSSPAYRLDVSATGTTVSSAFRSDQSEMWMMLKDSGTTLGHVRLGSASGAMLFYSGNNTRATLDASGNLGLGVTPSAGGLSGYSLFEMSAGGGSLYAGTAQLLIGSNVSWNGSTASYKTSHQASLYNQASGAHSWSTAPSGTAGNAISFTQAMTLDASGNLQIGNTSYAYRVAASRASDGIVGYFRRDGATVNPALTISCNETGNTVGFGTDYAGATSPAMTFSTQGTERARITSGGYFKASDNGTYSGITSTWHEFYQSANDIALVARSSNASLTSHVLAVSADRNTTNTSYYFIRCDVVGVAYRFQVADSGNVTNTNGSYGTISDVKMKTDIVDAGSQWNDIKAIRFRKFKMKDDPEQVVQLGVVAQEIEQTSPGLVEEHTDRDQEGNDLGTTTKSVKTSVLLMKAAVALQEAMARIEKLEAEVATLKGA